MLRNINNLYKKNRLRDKDYLFIFDKATEGEYVAFDTETTGLDPNKDSILSIGAVKIKNNIILSSEKIEIFISPEEVVGEESIKIHGIRNIDLVEGVDAESAVKAFLHFIESRPLVGYYISFDAAIINKLLKPILGITLPNKQIELSHLYRKMKETAFNRTKGEIDLRFDTIIKDLDLPILEKHDAVNDAIMNAMIFLKLINTKQS